MAKHYGRFNYIRIVEPHKKGGWPHLHVLIDGCNMHDDVVKHVTNCGFGWNTHVTHISPEDAARYMCKYLSKEWPTGDAQLLRETSKTRIVCVSRGMPAIFTRVSEWELLRHDMPSEHVEFEANCIIQQLHDHHATHIVASACGIGFEVRSDIYLTDAEVEKYHEPYVDRFLVGGGYWYNPFGLQEELDFFWDKSTKPSSQ